MRAFRKEAHFPDEECREVHFPGKELLMRRTLTLLLTAGVFGIAMGCCRTLQHTAGVCDCDPPCVESLFRNYEGISPRAEQVAPTIYAVPAPVPTAPEPPK
jgi:hypothetical protein